MKLLKISSAVAVFMTAALGAMPVQAANPAPEKVLRVCQDPNNMPFSSRDLTGFENKIAALLAEELGWTVAHTWYPQRMGFVRNTLRSKEPNSDTYKCDLVTSVAIQSGGGATTQPYYRSTYAMTYVKGRGLDGVKSLEDLLSLDPEKRKSLRIGVFARSPVVDWLLQNGLIDQIVSYQTQTSDPDQYPGEVVEKDLANDKIDVAFVWGPIAGYFAKNATTVPIVAIPLKPRADIKLDFSIAMEVRPSEKEFKKRIDQLLEKNRQKITAILEEYGVPLVDARGELVVQSK